MKISEQTLVGRHVPKTHFPTSKNVILAIFYPEISNIQEQSFSLIANVLEIYIEWTASRYITTSGAWQTCFRGCQYNNSKLSPTRTHFLLQFYGNHDNFWSNLLINLRSIQMEQSLIHSILCNTHFIEMLYQGCTITSWEHKTIFKRTKNHHDHPPSYPNSQSLSLSNAHECMYTRSKSSSL